MNTNQAVVRFQLNGLAAQLRPQEVQADRDAGLARG